MKNVTYLLELFFLIWNMKNLVFLEGEVAIVIKKESGGCSLALCSVLKKNFN